MITESEPQFQKALEQLLNRYCIENDSNTPDFILAEYVINCLKAYGLATRIRSKWFSIEEYYISNPLGRRNNENQSKSNEKDSNAK